MIKTDLVDRVMASSDLKKPEATEAVNALFEGIKKALLRGDRIELRGFGVFQVKNRKRGIGRNPKTGREVEIPPGKTIRFKPGKGLRDIG
jgi:DNA-binding protein HU-beta